MILTEADLVILRQTCDEPLVQKVVDHQVSKHGDDIRFIPFTIYGWGTPDLRFLLTKDYFLYRTKQNRGSFTISSKYGLHYHVDTVRIVLYEPDTYFVVWGKHGTLPVLTAAIQSDPDWFIAQAKFTSCMSPIKEPTECVT
jgi:hypothetical protein